MLYKDMHHVEELCEVHHPNLSMLLFPNLILHPPILCIKINYKIWLIYSKVYTFRSHRRLA